MADENKSGKLDMTNDILDEALDEVSEDGIDEVVMTKEQKRRRLIKTASLLIFSLIILIIAAIAWFTLNKEVGSDGMRVKVAGDNFVITMLANSRDGIFTDPYHIAVHDEEALYWKMTATNNLINYNPPEEHDDPEPDDPGDRGVHPGTEGIISFNVIPKTDNINLDFDFEVIGYQESTDEDDELVMTPLLDLENDEGVTAQDLLNGHILLFEERTETTVDGVTTVTYSKPILSNADMNRIMNRTFTGENVATQVDIYWVWPNTLSTLVDSRTYPGITTVPICEGASYTAIIDNVETYPQYYLKGAASGDNIDESTIATRYDYYGDMYDQGDNEIGMRVHYLLIKLSISEGAAGGGGS